ncbi:MAG: hypothetical protein GWO08_03140, partial [Gammaproteobacteria bacterium]|nr:hypothetical protein [Gammaproteobacteria bacterium]
KQGNKSSPSVHVHASCQNEDYDLHLAEQFRAVFAPEIWVLALAADVDHRGSQYCKITGLDDHHSYMNLRHMRALTEDGKPKIKAGQYFWDGPHIEIRTWEGDYNNPQYIEGAVHCTAAIAQLMSSKMIARKLIGLSMLRRNSFTKETVNIGASMNVDNIISMVDPDVLAVLQHAMTTVTYAGQDDVAA